MSPENALIYAITELNDLLPVMPTKATFNKLLAMIKFEALTPRPIESGTVRMCDWCNKPRGDVWIVNPLIWCWFVSQKKWRDDICIPCFRAIPGVKKWMQRVAPEMLSIGAHSRDRDSRSAQSISPSPPINPRPLGRTAFATEQNCSAC